ncbi:MAG: tripartite tricarboxylate transporter substrate binding protein [Burkholderiaceae bacterium]
MKMLPVWLSTLALCSAALLPGLSQAQDYPSKPVIIVVPSPPGGGFDLNGRLMAEGLTKHLGGTFVVENRTGAGTLIGTQTAKNAAPDGYTLVVGGLSNMIFNAALYKDPKYDPQTDFVPVELLTTFPYALVARPDLPTKDFKELVAYARANPGKLTIGTAGPGTGQHIMAEALINYADIKLTMVPYRGAQAAYQDLLAGRIDLFVDSYTTIRPFKESGKVKALLITSPKRMAMMSDVPTARELGLPSLEAGSWLGLFAPAKTPPAIIEKLRTAIVAMKKDDEPRGKLEKSGVELMALSPAQTRAFVKSEYETWVAFIKKAGIALD